MTTTAARALPVMAGLPRSRAEQLALAVESRIRDDDLGIGASIGTIDELCGESGFSRPTVNEAIRLLRDRGAVVIKPGRGGGTFVARSDSLVRLRRTLLAIGDDTGAVADAIELRDHLELLIALAATRVCSAADLIDLRNRLGDMADAPNWEGFLRANWALHTRIAAICPNELARAVYLAALDQLDTTVGARLDDADPSGYRARRLRAHAGLIDAIASGDDRRVRAAVTRHNSASEAPAITVSKESEK